MVKNLLVRGMLLGILAGILSFGFLKIVGEPAVDRAIAFETAMDEAKEKAKGRRGRRKGHVDAKEDSEPELVSRRRSGRHRAVHRGNRLQYGFRRIVRTCLCALLRAHGLFDQNNRRSARTFGHCRPVYVIPNLKYRQTRRRSATRRLSHSGRSFISAIIAISLAAMIAAWMLRNRLAPRLGGWNSAIIAAAAYLVVMIVVSLALPGINEVPEAFPAVLLWQFRMASLGRRQSCGRRSALVSASWRSWP